MDRLADFIAMGGYAGYVWSAYAISAVALLFMWWQARNREQKLLTMLAEQQNAERQQ